MARVTSLSAWSGVLLTAALGCDSKGPQVVDVQGRITKGGEPVAHALVHFRPSSGRPSSGRTDSDGNYRLSFSQSIPYGALVGSHRVNFGMEQGSIDEPADPRNAKYHSDFVDILRTCGRYESTPVVVEVAPKSKRLDIELDDFLSDEPD